MDHLDLDQSKPVIFIPTSIFGAKNLGAELYVHPKGSGEIPNTTVLKSDWIIIFLKNDPPTRNDPAGKKVYKEPPPHTKKLRTVTLSV